MGEAKHKPDTSARDFLDWLENTTFACEHTLTLALPGAHLQVKCSEAATTKALQDYFRPWLSNSNTPLTSVITVVESAPVGQALPWQDWQREAGKTGRKDTYIEFSHARLIRKFRTGMVFLQSQNGPIAIGPAADNLNQIVNFINNQAMNKLQQDGWLIGHAAAASYRQQAIAIAGFSGGGKSTSMLRLMDHPEVNFISNDRVFIQPEQQRLMLAGVAKMPRVNPGTLLNNPRLAAMLTPEQLHHYQTLAPEQLWELEEKHDVMIPGIYGSHSKTRIENAAPLSAVILLNWNRLDQSACRIEAVEIFQRQDLLPALMKSPGPFYQNRDGTFIPNGHLPDPQAYLQRLQATRVFEVSGGVDFSQLRDFCWGLWGINEANP